MSKYFNFRKTISGGANGRRLILTALALIMALTLFVSCDPDPYVSKEEVTFTLGATDVLDDVPIAISDNGKVIATLKNTKEGSSAIVVLDEGEHSFTVSSDSKIYEYSIENRNLTVNRHTSYTVNLSATNKTYEVTFNSNGYDNVTLTSLTLTPEGKGTAVDATYDGVNLKATLEAGRKYSITDFSLNSGSKENYQVKFEGIETLSVEDNINMSLVIADSDDRDSNVVFTVESNPDNITIKDLVLTADNGDVVTATIDGSTINASLKRGRTYNITSYELSDNVFYLLELADGKNSFTVTNELQTVNLQIIKGGTINFNLHDDANILPESARIRITVDGRTIELSSSNSIVSINVPVDDSVSGTEYSISYEIIGADGYETIAAKSVKPVLGKTNNIHVYVNDTWGTVSVEFTGVKPPEGIVFTLSNGVTIDNLNEPQRVAPGTYTVSATVPNDQVDFYEVKVVTDSIEVTGGENSPISAHVTGYGIINFRISDASTDIDKYKDLSINITVTSSDNTDSETTNISIDKVSSLRLKASADDSSDTKEYSVKYEVLGQDGYVVNNGVDTVNLKLGDTQTVEVSVTDTWGKVLFAISGVPQLPEGISFILTDSTGATTQTTEPVRLKPNTYSVKAYITEEQKKYYDVIINKESIQVEQGDDNSVSVEVIGYGLVTFSLNPLDTTYDKYTEAVVNVSAVSSSDETISTNITKNGSDNFLRLKAGETYTLTYTTSDYYAFDTDTYETTITQQNFNVTTGSATEEIDIIAYAEVTISNRQYASYCVYSGNITEIDSNKNYDIIVPINTSSFKVPLGVYSNLTINSMEVDVYGRKHYLDFLTNNNTLKLKNRNKFETIIETLLYESTDNNEYSIYGYSGEATSIVIPASINEKNIVTISQLIASNSKSIRNIRIEGNNLKTIEQNAFNGFESLESINIPESVDQIEKYAFYNCTSLSLKIPGDITYIGDRCFDGWGDNQIINFTGMSGPGENWETSSNDFISPWYHNCNAKIYFMDVLYEPDPTT